MNATKLSLNKVLVRDLSATTVLAKNNNKVQPTTTDTDNGSKSTCCV